MKVLNFSPSGMKKGEEIMVKVMEEKGFSWLQICGSKKGKVPWGGGGWSDSGLRVSSYKIDWDVGVEISNLKKKKFFNCKKEEDLAFLILGVILVG